MAKSNKPVKKARSATKARPGFNFFRQDEKKNKMLSMLTETGNAKRDKDGKVVKEAAFQSKDAEPGRVQADRRWFGESS
jgi:nuclear GTP-binding protein